MPPNLILLSTFALSQIAMPGLVRPRMPTVIGFPPGTCTRFSTYGGNTGRPVVQSWALAPSSGNRNCRWNLRRMSSP